MATNPLPNTAMLSIRLDADALAAFDRFAVGRGGGFPEVFDVCFSLPLNSVSDVVPSPYGFHVFRVVEHLRAREHVACDGKAAAFDMPAPVNALRVHHGNGASTSRFHQGQRAIQRRI